MGNEKFLILHRNRTELARLRIAVSEEALAVYARVRDKRISPNPIPSKGSCVEIFGSMPGTPYIGQVFLVPSDGTSPPEAYRQGTGKQVPAPEIRLASSRTSDGYELRALVPLSLLRLEPGKDRVLLEFQVTAVTSVSQGKPVIARGTLFGSSLAYIDNSAYGIFLIRR